MCGRTAEPKDRIRVFCDQGDLPVGRFRHLLSPSCDILFARPIFESIFNIIDRDAVFGVRIGL